MGYRSDVERIDLEELGRKRVPRKRDVPRCAVLENVSDHSLSCFAFQSNSSRIQSYQLSAIVSLVESPEVLLGI